jgi:hypothetical protein
VQGYRRKIREEPLEDYIKNIMLTNNDYLQKWRSELNIKRRLEKKKLLRWKLRRIRTLRLLKGVERRMRKLDKLSSGNGLHMLFAK